ncbi:rhamnulokinase [Gimesia sp.]|uniref:rhamnulokinase n=1 Tax=Gimesia sp. TaxID=2024833 RepID=UPI000C4EDCBF|nr:rhamnulokinase [Gimesia sp.]MAX38193.1 rhamnulokinase [Gimesia sp.]HAH44392.1 rhamnulokinase [Planctomycetaceae bacterium]HBL47882.1 rhamnulokinase [Planctomycetaceae bacterium]|tara:strand:+ start:10044 stop:11546 length:1503 start_codon:yes stop_codon:yes gene_type:complete
MPAQCFLGIDLGAESGRVLAGILNENKIQLEEIYRFSNGPVPLAGTRRWNVTGLWASILKGLSLAAQKYGNQIISVGVDTWGVDYVLLSEKQEMLGQPYHYRDPRTEGMLNLATSRVPQQEIFDATGLQFMEINTLYQLLAMQQTDPEFLDQAKTFLMIPDFFHWLLSGSQVVEFTNATTTQCLNPVTGDWAYELLRKLEIPTAMLPKLVSPGTKLGTLREDIMQITGLGKIDVIAPATHDTASAVAAIPTTQTGNPNWAYISSGTWSLMGVEVNSAVLGKRAFELNFTNEGGIDGTYRLLKNIMGLWLVQECKRAFERQGQTMEYSELAEAAASAEAFRSLVDPDDSRFLSPPDMLEAITQYCTETSQPVPETPGQYIRCALESLALKYQKVAGWLEELTGTPLEVIHIVGGGTKNELLNQLTANACQIPVIIGPVEATGLGNVLVQARAAGAVRSLSEIREIVLNSVETSRYEPQEKSVWEEAIQRFNNLINNATVDF